MLVKIPNNQLNHLVAIFGKQPLAFLVDCFSMRRRNSNSEDLLNSKQSVAAWYSQPKFRIGLLIVLSAAIVIIIVALVINNSVHNSNGLLYLTTHNYTNIIVFNGNDGKLESKSLLDMSSNKELSHLVKKDNIEFRGLLIQNENLFVVNGQHEHSFVGKFLCCNQIINNYKNNKTVNNSNSIIIENKIKICEKNAKHKKGLPFDSFFIQYNETTNWGFIHPYGIAHSKKFDFYFITTQNTNSILAYNKYGEPLSLPGMQLHYPGAILTLGTDSNHNDKHKYKHQKKHKNKYENEYDKDLHSIDTRHAKSVRGICIDESLNLIFIASESTNNVIAINIDPKNNFLNVYNITLPKKEYKKSMEPIDVIIGSPYHNNTLYVSDNGNDKVFAFKISKNSYKYYWESNINQNENKHNKELSHPSGMAISNNILYVISKNTNRILAFSAYNGKYIDSLVHFNYNKIGNNKLNAKISNEIDINNHKNNNNNNNKYQTVVNGMVLHNQYKTVDNGIIEGEQLLFTTHGGC